MGMSTAYHINRIEQVECRAALIPTTWGLNEDVVSITVSSLPDCNYMTMFTTVEQARKLYQALGDFLEAEDQKALKANRDKDQMELALGQDRDQDHGQVIGQMDPAPIEQSQDMEMASVIKQAQEHGLVREEGI